MTQYLENINCVSCPFKLSLFQHLTKTELKYLDENRYEVSFNAGETIFKQGGALTHMAALTSGFFKIYLEDSNKNNIILSILKPPGILGGPGFLTDSKHYFSVSALENSSVCLIDIKAFEKVRRQNSELAIQFIGYLNQKHINLYDKLISLTHKTCMAGLLIHLFIYQKRFIIHQILILLYPGKTWQTFLPWPRKVLYGS